jgi:16S rRNA processing protein RimM
VYLCDAAELRRPAVVRSCRFSTSRGGQALITFEGVNSIDDAKRLRWMLVQLPMSDRVQLPQGSYYVSDLIGCDVYSAATSDAVSANDTATATDHATRVGIVRDVEIMGEEQKGTPILVVEGVRGEVMIPLATEFCKVDLPAKRIDVNLPEGLIDLNSPQQK